MYVEQLTPLAGAVLWQTDPQPGSAVLPDGCMDLIWLNGQFVVAGPDTRPWHGSGAIRHASSDRGADRIVGLRFPAGVVPSLLGIPAVELRNTRRPLVELAPRTTIRRYESRAARGDPIGVLLELAERSLSEAESIEPMRRVAALCAGGRSIADIVAVTGWSERTVHRRCLVAFGYGAKTLERVLRFRRATALIGLGRPPAEVATLLGYADQAHLSRDVKEFSGRSPATFRPGRARAGTRPGVEA